MDRLRGAALSLLNSYGQCPLAKEALKIITIAMLKILLTPMRAPQRVLNATELFQAMVQRESEKLNGVMWVDYIIVWRTDFDDLLHTTDAVLGWLEREGLYATAHERMSYDTSIK